MQNKNIAASRAESLARVAKTRAEVAKGLDATKVTRHVDRVLNPKSRKSTLRKTGVALIAAPEPVTGVAGVAMIASTFAMSKDDPLSLADVARETAKILRDLESFSV